MHRCVNRDDVTRSGAGQRDDRFDVRFGDLGSEPVVRIAARELVDPTDAIDRVGDLAVLRRHDLAGVGQIDLVAVVLRGIV